MKNYMFGIDQQDPLAVARQYKELGLGALVINQPTEAVLAAADQLGLDLYLCFGAFSLSDEYSDQKYWARDYQDQPLKWFNSGCPNEPAIYQHQLEKAAQLAAGAAFKGVLVDGARFASPSPAASLAFLSCFCPRCAQKAAEFDLDFKRMQRAVASLASFIKYGHDSVLYQLGGLADWLRFRELTTKEYFDRYRAVLGQAGGQLELGAFIFADSLARLVGQTPAATAQLDLVCPMLYRAYEPASPAPACLNHEWADLILLLTERTGLYPGQALSYLGQYASLDIRGLAGQLTVTSVRQDGFLPDQLALETSRLKEKLSGPKICPIIQLEDRELAASIAAVQAGGADSYGFFAYRADLLPYLTAARSS